MMPLRDFLKALVDGGKYSQSEVARRAGVSQCVVSKIIVGNSIREPAPATYRGICTAFKAEWEEFLSSHVEFREKLRDVYGWAVPTRLIDPRPDRTCEVRARTSRYSNPNVATSGLVPIGITRFPPRFKLGFELRANLYDLAPTPEMLKIAKQPDGRDPFIDAYLARLTAIGPKLILDQLEAMLGESDGLVLLCYEDVTDGESWCHRLLLGDWLRQHAGLSVPELPDPGRPPKRRSRTRAPGTTSATASRTPPAARSAHPGAVGGREATLSGDP